MTTIDEMDEFFDFEDAAQPFPTEHPTQLDFESTDFFPVTYDANLAFAALDNDANFFTHPQHLPAPEQGLSHMMSASQDELAIDTAMMEPSDFTDFPRWIEGMDIPSKPCSYCQKNRIHCKILKEGLRKGSCTSCVALGRTCNLNSAMRNQVSMNDKYRCAKGIFCLAGNTIPDDTIDTEIYVHPLDQLRQPCDYCEGRGYQCKQINESDRIGACTSCVALDRHCSLTPNDQCNGELAIPDGEKRPANVWNPVKSPLEDTFGGMTPNRSTPSLVSMKASGDEKLAEESAEGGPKIGARFSRESVRVLRAWLSTHHRHPYPTDDEKESLKRQTGLNKTQITNWLANARRRGKVRAPRSTSPHPNGIDIPRRQTPGMEDMNPLERWKHSPPEHEPASITAITKAVTDSRFPSDHESPYASYAHSDEWSNRSLLRESSNSSMSLGTSFNSGNSAHSAISQKSKNSFGSFNSFGNRGRRRRRRQGPKAVKVPLNSGGPVRTFQCTFCTETFKTKHDWQRHEKSLHLSLERWICCPNGATYMCDEFHISKCVFCLTPNPDEAHAESHNYSSCTDRSLEERTFYRKDHLRQHLNLVHDVKFQAGAMESWKVATPEIRSRCGFCATVMDSWTFRVDHLAEHFKSGKSMADWKGDWGFEPQVLDIVENGMPPYLIHDERNSPEPFSSQPRQSENRSLEDLVKIGLQELIHYRVLEGKTPTDDDLLREARNIIRKSDEFAMTDHDLEISWFRDLLLSSGHNSNHSTPDSGSGLDTGGVWSEKLKLIKAKAPHNDIDMAAITCEKERQLKAYVLRRQALGLTPLDSELQIEACRILEEMEPTCNFKCKPALSWFKYLIAASPQWLADFRRRANLPRSDEMADERIRSLDDTTIDYSIHNHRRLEREMIEYVRLQLAQDITPTDSDLQEHARLIVYNSDDPWNQTALDDPPLLHLFKRQNGLAPANEDTHTWMPPLAEADAPRSPTTSSKNLHWDLQDISIGNTSLRNSTGMATPPSPLPFIYQQFSNQPTTNSNPTQPLKYFLNDANCYGRLVRELSRFVTTCTSVNNPNCHIPTDAEIQNQARWVVYDDDDPWNQTAADNAEWLIRFKRDVGLASPGLGLPFTAKSWKVTEGGSGFQPPYLNPGKGLNVGFVEDVPVRMDNRVYNIKAATARKFAKSMSSEKRWGEPGTVFCDRDLEQALADFVAESLASGMVITNEGLRAKARAFCLSQDTAADDDDLLEKFKTMHRISTSSLPLPFAEPLPIDHMMVEYTEESLLAELDNELAMGALDTFLAPTLAASYTAQDIAGGDPIPGVCQIDSTYQAIQIAKDYAETYRVFAATVSPLGRKVVVGEAERVSGGVGDGDNV